MFRKINLLLLVFSLMCSFTFISLSVSASDKKVENEGATYRVEEVVEECYLGYGLTYSRSIAYSSAKSGHYSGKDAGSTGGLFVAGKEYRQQVNLLDMEKESEVQLIPYAYLSGGMWNTTTTRNAALQFEMDNPGKKVIAAVNGDWFQIKKPQAASTGVTISNGEYYKNHTIHSLVNTLVFDNELLSGQRLYQIGDTAVKPMLAIYDEEGNIIKEIEINKVNQEPEMGEISLYFAKKVDEFEIDTKEQKVTNAYIIENAKKAVTMIADSFYGYGTITSYQANFDLGLGNFAIKTNNSEFDSYIKEGVTIRCQFEYANEALSEVKNAIGFPYFVMKDGVPSYTNSVITDAKTRKPRTFVGMREDGSVLFATVDGRQPASEMYGMNLMEMAALMEYYGCKDVWKFDGGGSSTMIIRKQSGFEVSASFKPSENNDWDVVNSPSDSSERSDGNCILMVVDVPEVEIEIAEITDSYAIINVIPLTDLKKFTDLYIFVDGKGFLVEDGKVKIENLKSGLEVDLFVYGKYEDEYYNLGVRKKIEGALKIPTELEMALTLFEKDGQKYIQIYYRVDNKQAIRSIDFYINDKRYGTVSSTILIPLSMDFFENIDDLKIEVVVVTSPYSGQQSIIFEDYIKEYTLVYLMNEIDYSFNSFVGDIFSIE